MFLRANFKLTVKKSVNWVLAENLTQNKEENFTASRVIRIKNKSLSLLKIDSTMAPIIMMAHCNTYVKMTAVNPPKGKKIKRTVKFYFTAWLYLSFNLHIVAHLSSDRTGGNSLQVSTENEKFTVMRSRSPQTLNLAVSRC